jgi:uncharacterized protein DUF6788
MAAMGKGLAELERRWAEVRAALGAVGELRPGALVGRYRPCGKPTCHCAQPGDPGHGPCWSLTRVVGGKTVTKVIPAAAVERTQRQIAEHRRFRDLVRELVEVGEQLCEERLPGAASDEAAQKGGSARPSKRRRAARSRRSSGPA